VYVPAWQGIGPGLLFGGRRSGPSPFPLQGEHTLYYYRARNAIFHLLKALPLRVGDVVLAPSYHSGNETGAIRAAGGTVRYFGIGRNLEPDLEGLRRLLERGARAVLVIHYLGWPQPIEAIRDLCREHGALLIEDCALSFLSTRGGQPLGSFGDYAAFCLYKTLPIPNGAALAQNGPPLGSLSALAVRAPGALSTIARSSELVLERLRGRLEPVGDALHTLKGWAGGALDAARVRRVPVGDMGFSLGDADLGMSPWARRLLPRFDYDEIRRRRRENFLHLLGLLRDTATPLLTALPEGVCPLFFPILVPDKGAAASALAARGVSSVEFWNAGDPEEAAADFPDTRFLRAHVLELPVHQDVTSEQIQHIARAVRELGLRL
jgi:dTDP-4-amino-4,6-dideoxygalactose transaminase